MRYQLFVPPLYPILFSFQKVLLLLVFLSGPFILTAQKVNVIYMMVDDMGYADLSCYGRKDYQTPNLDKLAAGGMKFMNAYAAAPVCTPTRAAFMTGRYPARIDIGLLEPWTATNRDFGIGLSPATFSIVRSVKNAGYETALIGKWHLFYAFVQKRGYEKEVCIERVNGTWAPIQASLPGNMDSIIFMVSNQVRRIMPPTKVTGGNLISMRMKPL